MDLVTVHKLDQEGQQVFEYPGHVLSRGAEWIVLRTTWQSGPTHTGFVVLEREDLWTEHFFSDRWYNIFEIRSSNGRLKGWYCNVTRPARILGDRVSAEDLALDLWVDARGQMLVLDEDEFEALNLSASERMASRQALTELQAMVVERRPPFDAIAGAGTERGTICAGPTSSN
jgi:predicted RNA-binding protein associated with RNAse of E/G family